MKNVSVWFHVTITYWTGSVIFLISILDYSNVSDIFLPVYNDTQ